MPWPHFKCITGTKYHLGSISTLNCHHTGLNVADVGRGVLSGLGSGMSQLVKRAERGERITIARNGKPVAQIGPAPRLRRAALPPDDPLLNLETFAVAGKKPGHGRGRKKLSNDDIDQILCGKP